MAPMQENTTVNWHSVFSGWPVTQIPPPQFSHSDPSRLPTSPNQIPLCFCILSLLPFSQRTSPGLSANYRTRAFWSGNLQKGRGGLLLLQRNNFPLHFLSWTKTPFKWMAFAHSMRPQLGALLPTPILWSRSGHAEDEGMRGTGGGWGQQVHTWNNCNYWPDSSDSGRRQTGEGVDWSIYLSFCYFTASDVFYFEIIK